MHKSKEDPQLVTAWLLLSQGGCQSGVGARKIPQDARSGQQPAVAVLC
jgi:hypothetical protein